MSLLRYEIEVIERTLEQGIGFNAAVRVGSKEAALNFNMNPFSGNPSLEGYLKIPEIDILGLVKISVLTGFICVSPEHSFLKLV